MDEFVGGAEKAFNPRKYFNSNKESKPVKYVIEAMFGENGQTFYNLLDISVGLNGMSEMKNLTDLSEVVGAYDTLADAQSAASELLEAENN